MKCAWVLVSLVTLAGCGPSNSAPKGDAQAAPVVHAPQGSWTNADIDLALYPGAVEIDGSRTKVSEVGKDVLGVSFQTRDARQAVVAFYRAELLRTGTVDDKAPGNVAITSLAAQRTDGTTLRVQVTDAAMGGTLLTLQRAFPSN